MTKNFLHTFKFFLLCLPLLAQATTPVIEYQKIQDPQMRKRLVIEFHNSNCNTTGLRPSALAGLVGILLYEAQQAGKLMDIDSFLKPAIDIEARKSPVVAKIMSTVPVHRAPKLQLALLLNALACKEFVDPYRAKGSFLNALLTNLLSTECDRQLISE